MFRLAIAQRTKPFAGYEASSAALEFTTVGPAGSTGGADNVETNN